LCCEAVYYTYVLSYNYVDNGGYGRGEVSLGMNKKGPRPLEVTGIWNLSKLWYDV